MKVEIFSLPATVAQDYSRAIAGTTLIPVQTQERVASQTTVFGGSVTTFKIEITGAGLLNSSGRIDSTAYSLGLSNGQTLPMATFSEVGLYGNEAAATAIGTATGGFARAAVLGIDDKGAFAASYLQGNDTLIGSPSANFLYGGSGNDRITGGAGADLIDGGSGSDVSVYREAAHADYLVSRSSNGHVRVATKDGSTDTNVGIETLEFDDGSVATAGLRYLPGYTEPASGSVGAIYRFYNARDKAFFYTNSVAERDMIIRESTDASYTPANGVWPYFYQGATFEQAHSSTGSTPVFRFYNTDTGHHFFTTSQAEKDMVQKESTDPSYGQPGLWPFVYEGIAFNAFADANHRDALPVYRFYSAELNRHFFTGSAAEANEIQLTGQWISEGVGYWGEIPG